MSIKYNLIEVDKNIEVLVVENAFDKNVYEEIWEETLKFAKSKHLSDKQEITGVAILPDGTPAASGKNGIYLDLFYENRLESAYLRNYKKFITEFAQNKEIQKSITWRAVFRTTRDTTLFSKYDNNGYYEGHTDQSVVTQLFWICSSPQKFTGGDLVLVDLDLKIEYCSNKVIFFPGWVEHIVTPVVSKGKSLKNKNCRFSYSTFYKW